MDDHLEMILARKRVEVGRRLRHRWRPATDAGVHVSRPASGAALRREGLALPRVIAEIKHASPSAGVLRPRRAGEVARLARGLEGAGASAISVLADRSGFGGGVLDVRRAAAAVRAPVLFKEFVLGWYQVQLAAAVGASLVLLLVRALSDAELRQLVTACATFGVEPVVEAADEAELDRALATGARVVGVNARDLRTFRVAPGEARRLVEKVPLDRIAVYMSGVGSRRDLHDLAGSRADAALIGEGLMRTPDPAATLAEWLR